MAGLALTVKAGETVEIAGLLTVRLLNVRRQRVRLLFDGPAELPVHRAEVLEGNAELQARHDAAAAAILRSMVATA